MYVSSRKRKNIIIAILLVMVVGMAIAYSALSSNLKIHGTSKTDGNLLVEFIDIQESAMIDATTIRKDYEGTVANFQVDLKKPGSYAEYELTVQNKGNIDVYLNDIKGLDEANDKEPTDITFGLKGFYYDELLKASETKKFRVTVKFNSWSEELPSTSKDLTLELIYSQDTTGNHTPILPDYDENEYLNYMDLISNELKYDINEPIKNGLYAVDENGELTTSIKNTVEYRYIGVNPNNYALINGELWRMVGFFDHGIIKVIKDAPITNITWDSNGSNNFENSRIFEQMPSGNSRIYIGVGGLGNNYNAIGTALTFKNSEELEYIENYDYKNELISPSDYGFATAGGETTTRSQCLAQPLASWNDPTYSDCINNNWLNFSGSYWTLTKNSDTTDSVFIKNTDGSISSSLVTENHDVYYVKFEYCEFVSGNGTINNPYILLPYQPN